jgi:hypothetical protein
MKFSASIAGLFIAMSTSLLASAATAAPSSAPSLLRYIAATPVAAAPHRRSPTPHRRLAAPVERNNEVCDESDPRQVYDWSHWPHNPCWPCVSGDENATSAYPSWEVRPNCQ